MCTMFHHQYDKQQIEIYTVLIRNKHWTNPLLQGFNIILYKSSNKLSRYQHTNWNGHIVYYTALNKKQN